MYFKPISAPELPDAACLNYGHHLFVPDAQGETLHEEAKRVCNEQCPEATRAACLEYALELTAAGETIHGTWGGTTPSERRKILEDRGVARKRKAIARPTLGGFMTDGDVA